MTSANGVELPVPPPPPPVPLSANTAKTTKQLALKPPSEAISKKLVALAWRKARGAEGEVGLEIKNVKIQLKQVPGKEENENKGTGFTVWDVALVLSHYLELCVSRALQNSLPAFPSQMDLSMIEQSMHGHPSSPGFWNWEGKRVLEISTGSGVVGLVLGLLFPGMEEFIMTDQDFVLKNSTTKNIALNQANIPFFHQNAVTYQPCTDKNNDEDDKFRLEVLNWGEQSNLHSHPTPFDWIVVSDCVYPNVPANLLAASINELSTARHTVVLLGYEHRLQATRELFFGTLCDEYHFTPFRIPDSHLHPKYCADDIDLYLFMKS